MSVAIILGAAGVVLSLANCLALRKQREFQNDLANGISTTRDAMARVREEFLVQMAQQSLDRTRDYTTAIGEALRSTVVVTRGASQLEAKSGIVHKN